MKLKCDICLKLLDAKSLNYLNEKVNGKNVHIRYCDNIKCFNEAHKRAGYQTF